MQARGIRGTIICRRGKNIRQPTYWCFPYCFFVFTTCKINTLNSLSLPAPHYLGNKYAIHLHYGPKNSILMTKINVYMINLVAMGFWMQIWSSFRFSLSFTITFWVFPIWHQWSSNSSCQANVFIGNRCFKADSVHQYTWFLRVFVLCLLFVNRSKQLRAPEQSTDRLIPSKSKG